MLVTMGTPRYCPDHPPSFLSPVLFSLSFRPFFFWREDERKSAKNTRDIQHVYWIGILRDVVSWLITYFAHFYRRAELVPETCIHSTADGRNTLPRWITSIYPHKRSINLYIDGFDGSLHVRILYVKRLRVSLSEKKISNKKVDV